MENTKIKRKLATKRAMHGMGNKEVKKRCHWKMKLSQIANYGGESEEEGDTQETGGRKLSETGCVVCSLQYYVGFNGLPCA